MKNKLKRLGCAVLAICMLTVSQMAIVLAADTVQGVVDFGDGDASITIQGNGGQSLAGKKWKLHRLFDVENSVELESVQYTFNESYKASLQKVVAGKLNPNKEADAVTEYEVIDYIQSLNAHVAEGAQAEQELEGAYSDYRYFIEEVAAQLKADGVNGETVNVTDTTADNTVVLKGLPYGYYIIEDVTEVQDKHTAASLCIVTTANPETSMNVKSDYPTVTKKIQEDDGTIGWNDIADFEIGQTVPYKYESTLPDMNGYDTYYYAWHDIMDEALTLQEDSARIMISGTVDGQEKIYQLSEEEFSLVTAPENGVTFQIQISDIKKIVDREFPQFNNLSENVYGQKVTVTYNAVLNEKAAEGTGRPGFENDVRLEFSNNPNGTGAGQTGFTPWDTVVCFTYRVEGVKVNSNGKTLANAKFKLYYDEECTKEVFVKTMEGGYYVIHTDSVESQNAEDAASICSDTSGVFKIYGLDGGTYYLKETEAPAGYRPILDAIKIEISPSFPEDRNSYVKGEGATEAVLVKDGSIAISVVNEIGKKLPITGSYLMPILFAAGAVCIIAGMKLGKKKYE
ncbi:MAG: isopeptide-forming domain-containing fimbrial protein [Tyzzerella sp.]|nr:isopeptide-forming domain-containing fimbrial protein [Tyzzerella sp.]